MSLINSLTDSYKLLSLNEYSTISEQASLFFQLSNRAIELGDIKAAVSFTKQALSLHSKLTASDFLSKQLNN